MKFTIKVNDEDAKQDDLGRLYEHYCEGVTMRLTYECVQHMVDQAGGFSVLVGWYKSFSDLERALRLVPVNAFRAHVTLEKE